MFNLSGSSLTERSKGVLLMWIISVICVSCLSVILSCLFVASLCHLLGKG